MRTPTVTLKTRATNHLAQMRGYTSDMIQTLENPEFDLKFVFAEIDKDKIHGSLPRFGNRPVPDECWNQSLQRSIYA